MLYRAVVKKKVKDTFAALSAGDSEVLLDQLADPFSYEFIGEHALGGRRTSKDAMRRWFARLDHIFTDLRFTPRHIEVGGPPWNTTVLTEVELNGRIGSAPYKNVLFQRIRLNNGKIFEIVSLEDTQHLVDQLQMAAAAGIDEASAEPITG